MASFLSRYTLAFVPSSSTCIWLPLLPDRYINPTCFQFYNLSSNFHKYPTSPNWNRGITILPDLKPYYISLLPYISFQQPQVCNLTIDPALFPDYRTDWEKKIEALQKRLVDTEQSVRVFAHHNLVPAHARHLDIPAILKEAGVTKLQYDQDRYHNKQDYYSRCRTKRQKRAGLLPSEKAIEIRKAFREDFPYRRYNAFAKQYGVTRHQPKKDVKDIARREARSGKSNDLLPTYSFKQLKTLKKKNHNGDDDNDDYEHDDDAIFQRWLGHIIKVDKDITLALEAVLKKEMDAYQAAERKWDAMKSSDVRDFLRYVRIANDFFQQFDGESEEELGVEKTTTPVSSY
ncbi:hypothetical protein CONLIGDRAFT_648125 [Coniochaeta ligniaria NRRL 30616]|uniref:Uncharacterized protein n=1 Tax=Coniochaeta ligniaria NRRL 30616 TaxID=1408157 RepID=A0A1J7IVE0_9PEZI|nr:hypothetical protein CONLIGDRAFT_648125 [Coniochaeta ligniaria NRRL 30616]